MLGIQWCGNQEMPAHAASDLTRGVLCLLSCHVLRCFLRQVEVEECASASTKLDQISSRTKELLEVFDNIGQNLLLPGNG